MLNRSFVAAARRTKSLWSTSNSIQPAFVMNATWKLLTTAAWTVPATLTKVRKKMITIQHVTSWLTNNVGPSMDWKVASSRKKRTRRPAARLTPTAWPFRVPSVTHPADGPIHLDLLKSVKESTKIAFHCGRIAARCARSASSSLRGWWR